MITQEQFKNYIFYWEEIDNLESAMERFCSIFFKYYKPAQVMGPSWELIRVIEEDSKTCAVSYWDTYEGRYESLISFPREWLFLSDGELVDAIREREEEESRAKVLESERRQAAEEAATLKSQRKLYLELKEKFEPK